MRKNILCIASLLFFYANASDAFAKECALVPTERPHVQVQLKNSSGNKPTEDGQGDGSQSNEDRVELSCKDLDPAWVGDGDVRSFSVKGRGYLMFLCDERKTFNTKNSGQVQQGDHLEAKRSPIPPKVGYDLKSTHDKNQEGPQGTKRTQKKSNAGSNINRQRGKVPIPPIIGFDIAGLECEYDRKCKGYRLSRGGMNLEAESITVSDNTATFSNGCIEAEE